MCETFYSLIKLNSIASRYLGARSLKRKVKLIQLQASLNWLTHWRRGTPTTVTPHWMISPTKHELRGPTALYYAQNDETLAYNSIVAARLSFVFPSLVLFWKLCLCRRKQLLFLDYKRIDSLTLLIRGEQRTNMHFVLFLLLESHYRPWKCAASIFLFVSIWELLSIIVFSRSSCHYKSFAVPYPFRADYGSVLIWRQNTFSLCSIIQFETSLHFKSLQWHSFCLFSYFTGEVF